MASRQTIFALSSGRGRAGVAVIRISGPAAAVVLERMAKPLPKPRYAAFRRVRHPDTSELLDEALVLWIPGPRSETGEDMAELHIHGGSAVLRSILHALVVIDDCRLAEPGEFARRAFENGKVDLTAVEGLADLVDAETNSQRRLALSQAGGALARLYDSWRERIISARALVEAAIDFSDEADVSEAAMADGRRAVNLLAQEVRAHLQDNNRGEIIRDGFHVVLAGPPNVGKSSLLNALARRDVAIVSEEPGTTRDVIEVRLDLNGYAVVLSDTAGLRETSGKIEREGIRRTMARARSADLVIWLVDATAPQWAPLADFALGDAPFIIAANKIDLVSLDKLSGTPAGDVISISASNGAGLDDLTRRIAMELAARVGDGEGPVLTQLRHRRAIEDVRASLVRFLDGPLDQAELRAEDLRIAADALARVVGRIDVEDVLGEIFGRFCIGK